MSQMSDPVVSAQGQILVFSALSRAAVVPFDHSDWSGWAGAVGEAHMVHFTREDLLKICEELGILDWTGDTPEEDRLAVILDEGGITFNTWIGETGFVGALTISTSVTSYDAPPNAEELAGIRERDKLNLYNIHRAFISGRPTQSTEIPKSRRDLHDYYGEIVDKKRPKPDWETRGRHIQFAIKDPKYDEA
jgi:hypothetical protein